MLYYFTRSHQNTQAGSGSSFIGRADIEFAPRSPTACAGLNSVCTKGDTAGEFN
jgi:hypothetical protein